MYRLKVLSLSAMWRTVIPLLCCPCVTPNPLTVDDVTFVSRRPCLHVYLIKQQQRKSPLFTLSINMNTLLSALCVFWPIRNPIGRMFRRLHSFGYNVESQHSTVQKCEMKSMCHHTEILKLFNDMRYWQLKNQVSHDWALPESLGTLMWVAKWQSSEMDKNVNFATYFILHKLY